jgi:glycosyltransferase involved in cell wall biosynthesis
MHCGVPVLATRRGSVPEIVEDGISGVVCDDPAEMVAAARIADRLFDRAQIQQRARARWSATRMAQDYLALYRQAMAERELPSEELAGT